MTQGVQKKRKVFQVAKELKVATPTILEFLESKEYSTERKQMQPITEEMYVELLRKFDRARHQQYQREMESALEEDKKRDSARLREEELEKIIAAKPSEDTEQKKVDLPKYRKFVVKEAEKAPEPPAPEDVPEVIGEETTTRKKAKKSAARKKVEDKVAPESADEVVEQTAKADRKQEKTDEKIETTGKDVKPVSEPEKAAEDQVIDADLPAKAEDVRREVEEKKPVMRKIELPKQTHLKVVEPAPKPKPKPQVKATAATDETVETQEAKKQTQEEGTP